MINLLDAIIIIIILITGVLGYKRGVFKEIVVFIGTILVFVLSYYLKNFVGDFFVLNFPFMDFPNFLKGAAALNIVVYQSLAFVITALFLFAIYDFLISLTGLFEKLLRLTIILGIPSKILGFIVGLVEGYVIAYIFVFFICQPAFNIEFAEGSKYSDKMLNNTPILTEITKDTLELTEKISDLIDIDNANEMNLRIVDIVLEHKVTSVEVVERLVEKGKLNVKNIDTIINKYKKGE